MSRHLAAALGLVLTLCSAALAQIDGQIRALDGERRSDSFGHAVAAIGDVDGDGLGDFVVGAPLFDGLAGYDAGKVSVYSGGTGALLYAIEGESGLDSAPQFSFILGFGTSVAAAGDVDGDGRGDFLVGDPGFPPHGKVYLFSGPDGAPIRTILGEGYAPHELSDRFGTAVSGAGDVDGDGTPDVLVGAPGVTPSIRHSDYKRGRAYVVSGATGLVVHTFIGLSDEAIMGNAVDRAGDVDSDGTKDVIVGSPRYDAGAGLVGRVDVFSGRTGMPLHSIVGTVADRPVGDDVAGVGDLDADGFDDFALTDCRTAPSGAFGSVAAFSGRTGEILWRRDSDGADTCFTGVIGSKDLTGDGVPDVLACAKDEDGPAGEIHLGRVIVCSGVDGHPVASWRGETPQGDFGSSASAGFNANGDGGLDFVVGARHHDLDTTRTGRVYVVSPRDVSYIRAREGNVGGTVGAPENVLLVNGVAGSSLERILFVDRDEPIELSMRSPTENPVGPTLYAMYAWLGLPGPTTVTALPFGYGVMCMAPELTGGSPNKTWNVTGDPSFGAADRPSAPAPTIVFSRSSGVGRRATFFVQGLIENQTSPSGTYAVTNGVLVVSR